MNEKEKIDDLVNLIDSLMEGGKGHVNVYLDGENGEGLVETATDSACSLSASADCGCGEGRRQSACAQPTELMDIDEEE